MNKRIKSLGTMVMIMLLLSMCKTEKEDNGPYYEANIDMFAASLPTQSDRSNAFYYFSLDNGATWAQAVTLPVGQKYMVKIFLAGCSDPTFAKTRSIFYTNWTHTEEDSTIVLSTANSYNIDWSASVPKPSNVNAADGTAEFTMTGHNVVKATIIDALCTYDASSWTGSWMGYEHDGSYYTLAKPTTNVAFNGGSGDPNGITQDETDPNKFWMDNYFYDGVSAYFILNPATTSWSQQTITMPTQTTDEGGVASGTGTYDQCTGVFTIATKYAIGSSVYSWNYDFYRAD